MTALTRTVTVAAGLAQAFAAFTDLGRWWPRELTWTGDERARLDLEPWPGGRASEYGPAGFRVDWATVLEHAPPTSLRLAWQIDPVRVPIPDAERATVVTVGFEDDGDGGTRVTVTHDGFEIHGDAGDGYRDGMGRGWELLLARFAEHAGQADGTSTTPRVRRLTANMRVDNSAAAAAMLRDLLGLDVLMDLGWIRTLGAPGHRVIQVSVMEHGGSDAPTPALSVGVDDVDAVHARAVELGLDVTYPLTDEPWGVRRFMFALADGVTVNVVAHA